MHPEMFSTHYARELEALWSSLLRVAAGHPSAEPLLRRDADSRMQRLVQGAAFLFAHVRERVNDELPELGEPIVARALPGLLRPVPSLTVLELGASVASRRRGRIEAGALVTVPRDTGVVRFSTSWPTEVHPLVTRRLEVKRDARGLQRVTFVLAGPGALDGAIPEELTVFVRHADTRLALDLARAIAEAKSVTVRAERRGHPPLTARLLEGFSVRGLTPEDRVLPGRQERFGSSTLLRELAAFPEKHAFVSVRLPRSFVLEAAPYDALVFEIELPWTVDGAERLTPDDLKTCCVPAANVYATDSGVVRAPAGTPSLPVRSQEIAGARPYEVSAVVLEPGTPRETAAASWEHDLVRGNAPAHRVERGRDPGDGSADWSVRFLSERAFHEPVPAGTLRIDFLATDGRATSGLGYGDVRGTIAGAEVANVSRVTEPLPVADGRESAWRTSAYARMGAPTLAREVVEFLRISDPSGRGVLAAHVRGCTHRRVHRLDAEGDLHWGDHYTLDVAASDRSGCGLGLAYALATTLHLAFVERTDLSRTVTLTLVDGSTTLMTTAPRDGARAPFPFG